MITADAVRTEGLNWGGWVESENSSRQGMRVTYCYRFHSLLPEGTVLTYDVYFGVLNELLVLMLTEIQFLVSLLCVLCSWISYPVSWIAVIWLPWCSLSSILDKWNPKESLKKKKKKSVTGRWHTILLSVKTPIKKNLRVLGSGVT